MSKQVVIDNVSGFLDVVETRINAAVNNGGTIGATVIAQEIGAQYGLTVGQGVAIIGAYVASRGDLKSRKGKGGGIGKA
jgi:hypothetical protein